MAHINDGKIDIWRTRKITRHQPFDQHPQSADIIIQQRAQNETRINHCQVITAPGILHDFTSAFRAAFKARFVPSTAGLISTSGPHGQDLQDASNRFGRGTHGGGPAK